MNLVLETHSSAMNLNALAEISASRGFKANAKAHFKQAFEIEQQAAKLAETEAADMFTYFMFMRGAMTLAYKAGLFQEAMKIKETCLSKNPPNFIIQELNDITELIEKEQDSPKKTYNLEGILTNINSLENLIILENDGNSECLSLIVPQNLITEIVKKYWQNKVKIKARQTPNGIYVLDEIQAAA